MSQEGLVTLDVRQQMFPHKNRLSPVPPNDDSCQEDSTKQEADSDDSQRLQVPSIKVWSPYSTNETSNLGDISINIPDIEPASQGFTSDCLNIPLQEQSASPDSRLRHLSTEVLRDASSVLSPHHSSGENLI